MKTFENIYKQTLLEQLKKFLDNEIIISNDISHKPLEENENGIVVVIKTGLGQASSTSNFYDLINTTFTVNFLIDANNLQKLLGALTSLIWNYNGKWDQLTIPVFNIDSNEIEDKPFIYKPVFSTPVPVGSLTAIRGKTKSFYAAMAMFNISVNYSSNADLKPDEFELIIDNDSYPINTVLYDMTYSPSYDTALVSGNKIPKQIYLSENIVFSFRLLKTLPGQDELIDILTSQFFGNDFLSQKEIKLKRGNDEIIIQTVTVEERYEAGTKIIFLTLTR